jgi:hypothetical protein
LGAHHNTTYADLHAFDQEGLECLKEPAPPGPAAELSAVQIAEIFRIAESPPYEFGLPLRTVVTGEAMRPSYCTARSQASEPRASASDSQKRGIRLSRIKQQAALSLPTTVSDLEPSTRHKILADFVRIVLAVQGGARSKVYCFVFVGVDLTRSPRLSIERPSVMMV